MKGCSVRFKKLILVILIFDLKRKMFYSNICYLASFSSYMSVQIVLLLLLFGLLYYSRKEGKREREGKVIYCRFCRGDLEIVAAVVFLQT